MALPATTVLEIQTGGSDTLNGGIYDPSNANFDATLKSANATTSTPFVYTNAAADSALAGDINNWLFVKSGTNWNAGWAKISSLGAAPAPTITAGGTGYTVGDVLTVSGGTSTTAATYQVQTVSSGVITAIQASTGWVAGAYSVLPANAVSVTGGTGSGATLTLNWGWNVNAAIGTMVSTSYVTNTATGIGTSASISSGTWSIDFSQQGSVQVSLTGLGTAASNSLTINAVTPAARKAWIGNGIQTPASPGTNVTASTIFIISNVTSTSAMTLVGPSNFSTAGGAASGGTAGLGGALATVAFTVNTGGPASVAGMKVWVKAVTELLTVTVKPTVHIDIEGYTTIRGDGGKFTLKSNSAGLSVYTNNTNHSVSNVKLDGNGNSGAAVARTASSSVAFNNLEVTNFAGSSTLLDFQGTGTNVYLHDNTTTGVILFSDVLTTLTNLVCINNTGTSNALNLATATVTNFIVALNKNNGINTASNVVLRNGTVYGQTNSGLGISWPINTTNICGDCENVISYGNGGNNFSVSNQSTVSAKLVKFLNCASGGSSANVSGVLDALTYLGTTNPFDSTAIAALSSSSTLAQVFAAFSPNNTAGGGALLRGAGSIPYGDIGAVQHQDSGGGGGGYSRGRVTA